MKAPLILLADSQLLFANRRSAEFHALLRCWVTGRRGVYIGASNGDEPAYYQLGRDAMLSLGATLDWQCTPDNTQSGEKTVLADDYDFYLLAGGDVAQGWRYIGQPVIRSALERAHQRGALMLGISAGAVHLADALSPMGHQWQRYLGWCEAAIAVHEEGQGWPTRDRWRQMPSSRPDLLCIPMGAALLCYDERAYAFGQGVEWLQQDGSVRPLEPLSLLADIMRVTTRNRGEPNG